MAAFWRELGQVLEGLNPNGRIRRIWRGRRARDMRRRRMRTVEAVSPVVDALEGRVLLAVLPAPVVADPVNLTSSPGHSPTIIYNPSDPTKMVAAYTTVSTDSGSLGENTGIAVLYSNNSGNTWSGLPLPGRTPNPLIVGELFAERDQVSVAFDSSDRLYVLYIDRSTSRDAGAILLSAFDFSGSTPTADPTVSNQIVYRWALADAAIHPALAVDGGLANYTDPLTSATQGTQFQDTVYVAWTTINNAPATGSAGFSANAIKLVASADGGRTFTTQKYVNDGGNFPVNPGVHTHPQMVVSQGTISDRPSAPGVQGGQLSIIWQNVSGGSTAIRFDRVLNGGTGFVFDRTPGPQPIFDAIDPGGGAPHLPGVTTVTIPVAIPNTFTINDLDVTVNLTHPTLSQLLVELIHPNGEDSITLIQNGVTAANVATNNGIAGANLGILNGFQIGTVFDSQAPRIITDVNAAAPYTAHFRPEVGSLNALVNNVPGGAVSGDWTLRITDFRADTAPTQSVGEVRLNFTANLTPGGDIEIGTSNIAGTVTGTNEIIAPSNPSAGGEGNGIGPGAVIAADNTLGSFSPYQGRLYVAFASVAGTVSPDNSDIFLYTSDNGGLSWTARGRVNQDIGAIDGFSEGSDSSGRPQFQPSIAVDQATGTVVLSFYDVRHDAARTRAAMYIAASIDGGGTWGPQTWANRTNTVTDAITGLPVVLGPIPDNQGSDNIDRGPHGFGTHQGLTVVNGRVYPIWASNQNVQGLFTIRIGNVRIASGPRIVSSTMGPVSQLNDTVNPPTASGAPQFMAFDVEFDRPIDPATFTADDITVFYRNTATSGNDPGVIVPLGQVVPLDEGRFGPAGALGATRFRVNLASVQTATGTYSYQITPDISDRVRFIGGVLGNLMDQNGDGVEAQPAQQNTTVGDVYAIPRPLQNTSFNGTFFRPAFDSNTLPIIVPGPTLLPALYRASGSQTNLPVPPVGDGGSGNPAQDITTSSLTISGAAGLVVNDLRVHLSLNHTSPSDLRITLIHPDGTQIVLSDQRGGAGTSFGDIIFSNSALLPISSAFPPFAQSYRPEAGTPLSLLNGKPLNGTWQLRIQDLVAGTSGTLVGWAIQNGDSLTLNGSVGHVDVAFDRDMNPATFTVDDIVRITGPAGEITGPHRYISLDRGLAIPDASPALPLISTLSIEDNFLIGDLNVQLDITHPLTTDLTITLIAPNGLRVPLVANLGGGPQGTANFTSTLFDDASTAAITNGSNPFNSALGYRPVSPLSVLNGMSLKGVWRLEVADDTGTNVGTLNAWSIIATPSRASFSIIPNPHGTDPNPASPRTYRITFPTQKLAGTYTVVLSSDIRSPAGEALDTNKNAGLDLLRDVSTESITLTFPSSNVPLQVGSVSTPGQVTTSTLTITDSFVIQNVTLQLNITYPFDPDLRAALIAPDGTRIQLFTNVGQAGTQRDFVNTVFDDAATTPIQNGGGPFFGRFNPQLPLSSLVGKNAAGTWTLEITSDAAGRVGTLNSWSLTLGKPVPNSGLGELVADQTTVGFRIFSQDATLPQSHDSWTPVGPASAGGFSGRISSIAVDPSDPSGNTVFVAGASGGIWKTTNFLTTSAEGPTWVPLTDFGPTNSLNVGSLTLFPRNNDPRQTVVFVATGEANTTGQPDVINRSRGVGFLRSMDGGSTWTLLDSRQNVDASGNPLPMNSPARDHLFSNRAAGATYAYKIVVDPRPTPSGQIIVYAALGGANGGLWRSLDSGDTWQNMRAGECTDVVLDPNSGVINAISNPTGNLDILYAAFRGQGIFISPNRGVVWNALPGGVGNPLIREGGPNGPAVPVNPPADTPNGAKGRIHLAKPALTGNPVQDAQYQGWLYALVAQTGGALDGLYVTKDFGQNWTLIRLPLRGGPSNDITAPDVNILGGTGNYASTLAVDPTNPMIVYIGGSGGPNLIRVNIAALADSKSLFVGDDRNGAGEVRPRMPVAAAPRQLTSSATNPDPIANPFINLLRNPTEPFLSNATVIVSNVQSFSNNGSGALWADLSISNTGDGLHALAALRDPLSGNTRLILGNNNAVATGIFHEGAYISSLGTAALPLGNRTGNLQVGQFFYGAAQPSSAAAQIAQAMFYANAYQNGIPSSDPNLLNNGNLVWSGVNTGNAAGVAVDATGSGAVYRYRWPNSGGDNTNFFQVNGIARTFGLLQAIPDTQWPNATVNFAVNPVNGDQVVMSSGSGRIFMTANQGVFWLEIGSPTALGNSQALALAYGAPAPTDPTGALNNFIYAGTIAGQIYVTFTGGGGGANPNDWINISTGLDGSTVRGIVTNPQRGSREAYAVTNNGVYYIRDSSRIAAEVQTLTPTTLPTGGTYTLTFRNQTTAPLPYDATPAAVQAALRNLGPAELSNIVVSGSPLSAGAMVFTFDIVRGDVPMISIDDSQLVGNYPVTETTRGSAALAAEVQTLTSTVLPTSGTYTLSFGGQTTLPLNFDATPATVQTALRALPVPALANIVVGGVPLSSGAMTFTFDVTFGDVPMITIDASQLAGTYTISETVRGSAALAAEVQTLMPVILPTSGTYTLSFGGQTTGPLSFDATPATVQAALRALPVPELSNVVVDGLPLSAGAMTFTFDQSFGDVPSITIDESQLVPGALNNTFTETVKGSAWVNITGNLRNLMHDPFRDFTLSELQTFQLSSIQADWRYLIPEDFNDPNSPVHPALYVGATSGVYRSLDNGQTWSVFPDRIIDGSAVPGGYLPNAHVTDLDMALGNIDPTNGRPIGTGSPNVLMATTFGRGAFAIRLAPVVIPGSARIAAADDTGLWDFDSVTQIRAPLFTGISQQSAFGSNVRITLLNLTNPDNPIIIGGFDGVLGGPTDTPANRTDAAGRFAVRVNPNSFPVDGTYIVGVRATDDAGTVGAPTLFTVVIDTTAPAQAPSVPDMTPSSDSGLSNTDNITNITRPTFTGTTEPGAMVQFFLNGGTAPVETVFANALGQYTVTLSTPLADGIYSISAQLTDVAGNVGPRSAALVFVIDTTPPNAPSVPDLTSQSDSGISDTDNVTNVTTPSFSGTAEPAALVELFADGVLVGSARADQNGNWLVTVDSPLSDGVYNIAAQQTDLAGNVGPLSASLPITIDTVPPLAPSTPNMTAATDTGISSTDNLTRITTPAFSGTAVPNAEVHIYANGVRVGSGQADAFGNYLITITTPLAEGQHQITALQLDQAGNLGLVSAPLAIAIDTTPPVANGVNITAIEGTLFTGVVARFTDLNPFGQATINWGDGQVSLGTILANQIGSFDVIGTNSYAAPGVLTLTVTIEDAAGNPTTVTATATVDNPPVAATGGLTFNAQEGTLSPQQPVATFTDPGGPKPLGDYRAIIDWGDGTSSDGTITFNAATGTFTVLGSHAYPEDGSYSITVTIQHFPNAPDVVVTSTAVVANVAPTPTIAGPTLAFIGDTLEFLVGATDPSAGDTAAGFTYVINWGDGTAPTVIEATPGNGAPQSVTHRYIVASNFNIRVTVTDRDGGSNTSTYNLRIADPLTLEEVVINTGHAQRSRIFRIEFKFFDRLGVTSLRLANLKLFRNGTEAVSLKGATLSFDPETGWATLDTRRLKLADGDYQLQIRVPGGTLPLSFHKLTGDANGSGFVNEADKRLVAGGQGANDPAVDLNGDGVVNAADVNIVRGNTNSRLTAATRQMALVRGKQPAVNFGTVRTGGKPVAVDLVIRNAVADEPLIFRRMNISGNTKFLSFAVLDRVWGRPAPTFGLANNQRITVRIYLTRQEVIKLNSKLTFQYSRDGGTTFQNATVPIKANVVV